MYGLRTVILLVRLFCSGKYDSFKHQSLHYSYKTKRTSPHILSAHSRCKQCTQSLCIISEYEYMPLCPSVNPDSVSLSQEWSYRMKMRPQHQSLGSNLFELRSERDVVLHPAIIAAIGRLPVYNLAGEGSVLMVEVTTRTHGQQRVPSPGTSGFGTSTAERLMLLPPRDRRQRHCGDMRYGYETKCQYDVKERASRQAKGDPSLKAPSTLSPTGAEVATPITAPSATI